MSGSIYMCEFIPKDNQSFRIAFWLAIDSTVIIVVAFSYWKLTKDSNDLIIFAILQNFIFLITCYWVLPESPGWCLRNKYYQRAYVALS